MCLQETRTKQRKRKRRGSDRALGNLRTERDVGGHWFSPGLRATVISAAVSDVGGFEAQRVRSSPGFTQDCCDHSVEMGPGAEDTFRALGALGHGGWA